MQLNEEKSEFADQVLKWYKEYGRKHLPWRETHNPYRVLIAEFMLQKTTAQQVQKVFPRFVKLFPNSKALAEASKEEILEAVGELGLSYRAERMSKTAKKIVKEYGGKVPNNRKELLELPGVGRYIANSVLCYAFGRTLPVIDTNAGRIITRVFGLSEEGRLRQDEYLWELADNLLPESRVKEYNFGLLDLGALVCHRQNPNCISCPLQRMCVRLNQ